MSQQVSFERCQVMGVLNITPDSFSDGGMFLDTEKAVERAWSIKNQGADLIDIGGESTRPGSENVSAEEELGRVLPVLRELKRQKYPLPISLDTSKPEVAKAALKEGLVDWINDVEGLRNDALVEVVRAYGCPVVLMHMHGKPRTMQSDFHYDDVVHDLIRFFETRIEKIKLSGKIILDPGIGFGKSVEHNLIILKRISEIQSLGFPVLIGASKKSFIGKVLNVEIDQRLHGSLAVAAYCALKQVSVLRVHDVLETKQVVTMMEAIHAQ